MELTVHLNRDSVHAGDDLGSHALSIQADSNLSIGELIAQMNRDYLPGIAGGQATWIISGSGNSPNPLGVLAQQWKEPKLRVSLSTPIGELLGNPHPNVRFEYWCQKDPELVFSLVAAGNMPPPKW